MNSQEKIVEQYEDALFVLLMDEIAQSEGEKAYQLNELLKANPDAALPPDLQRRCMRTISVAFAKKSFGNAKIVTKKLFRYLSVAVLIVTALFTTVFALSESFRVQSLNAIIEYFDDHAQLQFGPLSPTSDAGYSPANNQDVFQSNYGITLAWLPEDYSLSTGWNNASGIYVEYANDAGDILDVFVCPIDSALTYQFDAEDTEIQEIMVHNVPATLYIKSINKILEHTILWVDVEREVVFQIIASNLSTSDIINVANHISLE